MSDTTDLVDRQIGAFQERDLGAFLACYARDARIRQFDGSVVAGGTDGLRSFYEPMFRDSPGLKARILHRIAADDYVIDEEETTGVNVPGFPATNNAVVIYQVKDGSSMTSSSSCDAVPSATSPPKRRTHKQRICAPPRTPPTQLSIAQSRSGRDDGCRLVV